jgi:hypothetical protein
MPPITASYRHSRFTATPDRLSPAEVWTVAHAMRSQLAEDRFERRLSLADVAKRLSHFEINGVAFEVAWDLEHRVLNPAGKEVMAVTEYDKASPDCVLVSVNGPMLESSDTLLRSTIAHEIGHLVFDAPGWVLVPPDAPVRSGFAAYGKSRDPRELRANEFMGALLVPPSLLRVDLQRQAKRHRFGPSPRPSAIIMGAPAYDGSSLDGEAVEEVIFTLAESYLVSESFLRVRLDRYDLLRSGRSWQAHEGRN